jgi:hypothetical protein
MADITISFKCPEEHASRIKDLIAVGFERADREAKNLIAGQKIPVDIVSAHETAVDDFRDKELGIDKKFSKEEIKPEEV